MKKAIIILFFIICTAFIVYAQNEKIDFANQKITNRGEFYFSFERPSKEILFELSKKISIDKVQTDKVFAYANRSEFDNFLLFNISFEPVYDYYIDTKATIMATTAAQMANWDRYPTFAVYQEMMQNFVLSYPTLCRLDTIGFSAVNNRPILCIVISDNISQIEDEPEFFWSSTMHGDELCGWILELRFADYILSNYETNTQVNNLVNNTVIYICPLANPDGTYKNSSAATSVSNSTRYNGNNIDLNRSFPYIDGAAYDFGASSDSTQSEVIAMQNYANMHNFTMGANLHGGASLINYPWDLYGTTSVNPRTNIRPADENWWLYVCQIYANLAIANSQGYSYSNAAYFMDCANEIGNDGITEGSDWYWISGSRQDYMNFFKHCKEVTLEVSVEKKLDVDELNNHWNFNRQAMLDYTEQILYGFRGLVTDFCNGSPLTGVKIEIYGHDEMGSEVYSFAPLGNYFRPIYAGTYNVTFSKDGYISKTLPIMVTNNNSTQLNVQLHPIIDNSIADFIYLQTLSCSGNIVFSPSHNNLDYYYWDFGDDSISNELNPIHTYNNSGIYSVNFTGNICGQSFSSSQNIILNNIAENPITIGDESCSSPAELTLSVSGNGTLNWYDAAQNGNLIHTGDNYSDNFIQTTTYYVENLINTTSNYSVGASSKTIGNGSFFTSTNSHYLTFDAQQEFVINSVLVYSSQNAPRTIQLLDAQDNVLDTKTVNITNNQNGVRVNLNFLVPVGSDYKLALAQGTSRLYRNINGGNYPYTINNVMSITGNSANDSYYYYYFYDWDISVSSSCVSARVPITALIIDNFEDINYDIHNGGVHCADSVLLSVFADNSICSECNFYWQATENNTIINSTIQGNSHYVCETGTYYFRQIIGGCISDTIPIYVTLFEPVTLSYSTIQLSSAEANDGSITVNINSGTPDFEGLWSNEQNTYGDNMLMANLGEGYYSITITDANNCKDSIQNIQITFPTYVIDNEVNNIEIFPNPSNGQFSIKSDDEIIKIEIYDVLGNLIISKKDFNSNFIELKLASGNYIIFVEREKNKVFQKISIK